jgi:hypothetical protein
VGCCVAMFAVGAAGPAHAVENLPPNQPQVADLQTEGKACGSGDDLS